MIILMLLVLIILIFLTYRNHWVYSERSKMLYTDLDEYLKLPSYYHMFWKIEVWDINQFKRKIE